MLNQSEITIEPNPSRFGAADLRFPDARMLTSGPEIE
jgi:hypothetical protein